VPYVVCIGEMRAPLKHLRMLRPSITDAHLVVLEESAHNSSIQEPLVRIETVLARLLV